MIEFVGHSLLLRCIGLDVDDIPNTVWNHICREFDWAMLCQKESFLSRARRSKENVYVPLKFFLNIWRVRAL